MLVNVENIEAAIEKLGDGQVLKYQLHETFGADIVYVELNTTGKGGKYILSCERREDDRVDGKPSGNKREHVKHNSAHFLAKWISQR
ncbi:MAG: hypothetical protein ABIB93_05600, partial [Chloroflexota bacterium]